MSFKGHLYLLGGDANQGYHQSDIWRSRDGRAWELVIERAPWAPRVLHMSFVFKDAIYVMGGQTMPKFTFLEQASETYYNDVWRSKDGLSWEKLDIDVRTWSPRSGIGGNGFVFNGKIFLVGGFNYDGLVNSKRPTHIDIWSSADGSVWKLENANPKFSENGEGFIFHDMAVFDNRLWIIGGARQWGDTAEIWSSKNGRDWTEHHCAPIPPSHASSVVGSEDGIIFAAGHQMTREVWKLGKRPK